MASIAVLKSVSFLAPLHVRTEVASSLKGVDGMIGLLRGARDGAALQASTFTVKQTSHKAITQYFFKLVMACPRCCDRFSS